MDLDEVIFTKFVQFFRNRTKRKDAANKEAVYLDDIRNKFTIIASALTGENIKILPAEKEGGFRDNIFFLPIKIDLYKSFKINLAFYFFRVFYLSVLKKIGSNRNINSIVLPDIDSYVIAEQLNSDVLEELFLTYPLLRNVYLQLIDECNFSAKIESKNLQKWLFGKWMFTYINSTNQKEIDLIGKFDELNGEIQNQTIIKSKPVEKVEIISVDKQSQEDYMLNHNFEKVETADEFNGNWRSFDGEDEMEDHEDALDELNLRFMVRTQERSGSIYQTEMLDHIGIAESAEVESQLPSILYHEWDYKKRRYLPNYCKVFLYHPKDESPGFCQRIMSEHYMVFLNLRKQLANLRNKRIQVKRQSQGDEFDLDAVVDMFTDLHSNHTPKENIYLDKRKLENEVSILLLLDTSLSSEGYVLGKKILDIEKEVAILFGEILNEFRIDFSIQCFNSRTRNHANYYGIKDFEDSWASSKHRIGSIAPSGYTRMGVAIRHSNHLLSNRDAKKKWLILLSDGKPNDFDRYEGKYGVADVKQALHEQNQLGINSYALAIESNAKFYLPEMFGINHFRILSSTDELVESLVHLFEKIKYS
jgi:nitric oxide reductase NorD protein